MSNVRLSVVGLVVLLVAQTGGVAAVGGQPAVATPADHAEQPVGPELTAPVDRSANAVLHATERALDSTPVDPLVALVGYSRYDDSDPLEHEVRNELHAVVSRAPGLPIAEVAREVDSAVSTVRYHVRVLERESLVEATRVDGRNRLYPVGFGGDVERAAALEDEATRAVLTAVQRHEPINVTALAEALDRSPSTVSHHEKRLVAAGLVDRERDGKRVQLSLTDRAADLLAAESVPNGVPSR